MDSEVFGKRCPRLPSGSAWPNPSDACIRTLAGTSTFTRARRTSARFGFVTPTRRTRLTDESFPPDTARLTSWEETWTARRTAPMKGSERSSGSTGANVVRSSATAKTINSHVATWDFAVAVMLAPARSAAARAAPIWYRPHCIYEMIPRRPVAGVTQGCRPRGTRKTRADETRSRCLRLGRHGRLGLRLPLIRWPPNGGVKRKPIVWRRRRKSRFRCARS
jgi:hypothetical protein